MNNFAMIIIIALISVITEMSAEAGYTENLYLCDLGIMSINNSNQLGVDFIQYTQNGKTLSVSTSTHFSTALNVATILNPSFDRWNPTTGINDVSINLESDFYGSQYYLEYCYTWDRILPSDNLNYEVTFTSRLSTVVPFTQLSADTNCSLKANNGTVINTSVSQSFIATNSITTDFSSMRCTIKLSFKENLNFIARPHNGDDLGINPNITVRVSP